MGDDALKVACELIARVRAHGGVLALERGQIVVRARRPLPASLLSTLRARREAIHAALAKSPREWTGEDWREHFEERAAIAEHDGRVFRTQAETQAFESCVTRWLVLNPPANPGSNLCAYCRAAAAPNALVILARDGSERRVVHAQCHAPLLAKRCAEAVAALKCLGVLIWLNPRHVHRRLGSSPTHARKNSRPRSARLHDNVDAIREHGIICVPATTARILRERSRAAIPKRSKRQSGWTAARIAEQVERRPDRRPFGKLAAAWKVNH